MSRSYPYFMLDRVQFHLETLPVYGTANRVEFLYKYKRPSENLYMGEIDVNNLLLTDTGSLLRSITEYFAKEQYLDNSIVTDNGKRLFPKVCWLTACFLKAGFEYPVAVHYNPRIQQNIIHPGSIRNHVIKLFQKTPTVNCLYFNTGGVAFDFIKPLRVVEQQELLDSANLVIELVADHGAIIPHINLDPNPMLPNIVKWQDFIYRRLTSLLFSVYCNKELDIFQRWATTEEQASVQVYINDKTTEPMSDIMCKCAILVILGISYESDALTVRHKIAFDTP